MRTGIALALLSALAFGLATPFIARAGVGLSPFATAALLYGGAVLGALLLRVLTPRNGASLDRRHVARLIAAGVVGAAFAPSLFAWGLMRTGAVSGSLLLCGEPVFTALLAWRLFAEPVGKRFALALALMVAAGTVLAVPGHTGAISVWGAVAIVVATFAWAIDNTISRGLAEQDPLSVVAAKGLIGVAITVPLALGSRPTLAHALVLLFSGVVGYGLSLRLYLAAQRRVGAGRTASVFAVAPFVGAVVALALGDRAPTSSTALAGALFAVGVWLHLTERHGHAHHHGALDHEHLHTHDDGHHDHAHASPFVGTHSHPHRHEAIEHDHEHAPDAHHVHSH